MKNKVIHMAALLCAALIFAFPFTAYAEDVDENSSEQNSTTAEPFSVSGTGTLVDRATDADGKEFYTIETESGNIFYLIVDTSGSSSNVYFLNAVTEAELLSLVEKSGQTIEPAPITPSPEPDIPQAPLDSTDQETDTQPSEQEPSEPPAKSNGRIWGVLIVLVIAAGVALYLFKFKKPKTPVIDESDSEDDEEYFYAKDENQEEIEMEKYLRAQETSKEDAAYTNSPFDTETQDSQNR